MCVTDDGFIVIRGYKPGTVHKAGGWFKNLFSVKPTLEGPRWIYVYSTPHHKVTEFKSECEHDASITSWSVQGITYLAEGCPTCCCIRVSDLHTQKLIHVWGPGTSFREIVKGTNDMSILVLTEGNRCFPLEWVEAHRKLVPDALSGIKSWEFLEKDSGQPRRMATETRDLCVDECRSGQDPMKQIVCIHDGFTISCIQSTTFHEATKELKTLWSLNTGLLKIGGLPLNDVTRICTDPKGRVYGFSSYVYQVFVIDGRTGHITQVIMQDMMANCTALKWMPQQESIIALYDNSLIDIYKVY